MRKVLTHSLTLRGFIVSEFRETMQDDFLRDMSQWVREGRVKYQEHIIDGFENIVDAFNAMLTGRNVGKTIVRFTA